MYIINILIQGQRGFWSYTSDPCPICKNPNDDDKNPILYCSQCNNEYHLHCVNLTNIPDEQWICTKCKDSNAKIAKEQNDKQTFLDVDTINVHPSCLGYSMKSSLGRCNYNTTIYSEILNQSVLYTFIIDNITSIFW